MFENLIQNRQFLHLPMQLRAVNVQEQLDINTNSNADVLC